MSSDSVLEKLDDRPALQTERLHNGQDALHEAAALRAMTAKAATTPQHGSALHALGVVVRRLDAFGHHEGPHGQELIQQPRAESPGLAVAATFAGLQHIQQLDRQW